MFIHMRWMAAGLWTLLALTTAGCASWPQSDRHSEVPQHLPLTFNAKDKMDWEPVTFPGKLRTAFSKQQHEGRESVQAESKGSASMLRQRMRISPDQLGRLSFEWQAENLLDGADLTAQGRDDSPARLVLAFDGDRQKFSARNAMLSELSRALTGEDMPYATLMYVWSNDKPVGTIIVHPRTDRIRKIVVESGPQRLRQWLRYERDVRADFEKVFGEEPGALQAVAIMTDSDNTQSRTRAWYGQIRLEPGKLNPSPRVQKQAPTASD